MRIAAAVLALVVSGGLAEAQAINGARVPPAASLVDAAGDVWTIGPAGSLARNGVASGGAGSVLWLLDGTLYALGTNQNWYQWAGYWFAIAAVPMPAVVVPVGGLLEFSIMAPSLAAAQGYVYRATVDGAGVGIVPVICRGPAVAAGFPCVMAFPAVARGRSHRLILTASDAAATSAPSAGFWFLLSWPAAAVPSGVRFP